MTQEEERVSAEAVTEADGASATETTVTAEELAALQREIPEITDDALPASVVREAREQGLTLLDAYLRYRLREERAVQTEQQRQQRTVGQSVGSLHSSNAPTHPESDAFARSFASAIQY